MSLKFSNQPGPRERHLQRKYKNPLFTSGDSITEENVLNAREQDEIELNHFLRYFRDLVQEAIDLKSNADSDVVLDIKERLDKCFVHCCALPGDHSDIKAAVNKLVEVIMKAVRQGAANDPLAQSKLDEEDLARRMHNELAEHILVADLLLPDSPIAEDELVATLLSETTDSLEAALSMFDAEHISDIFETASALLAELDQAGKALPAAHANLELIKQALNKATAELKVN